LDSGPHFSECTRASKVLIRHWCECIMFNLFFAIILIVSDLASVFQCITVYNSLYFVISIIIIVIIKLIIIAIFMNTSNICSLSYTIDHNEYGSLCSLLTVKISSLF